MEIVPKHSMIRDAVDKLCASSELASHTSGIQPKEITKPVYTGTVNWTAQFVSFRLAHFYLGTYADCTAKFLARAYITCITHNEVLARKHC